MSDNPVDSWVEDGTPEAEPVTESTPAEATPVEAAPEPVVEAPAVETPTEPVEAVTEPEAPVQTFIDAQLNGETYELPEGVKIALRRGDEVEYVDVLDVQKNGMFERDYRHKTTEHASAVREFEARRSALTREQAALEARTTFLEEQEQTIKDATTDPDKAAAYAEHLRQYQSNPIYRANVDSALSTREVTAERDALQADVDQRLIEQGTRWVMDSIADMAGDFPTVDPQRVLTAYGAQLELKRVALDPTAIRTIFQAEADNLSRESSPLQRQFAELTAKVAAMEGASAAETHNAETQHAVTRATTPKVNTGRGAPTTTPVEPTKFTPRELPGRISEWVKAG